MIPTCTNCVYFTSYSDLYCEDFHAYSEVYNDGLDPETSGVCFNPKSRFYNKTRTDETLCNQIQTLEDDEPKTKRGHP